MTTPWIPPGNAGLAGARVLSVNVGLPREVESDGRTVRTSIHKSPVAGPVMVRRHNLDGDRQSDLAVHGGPYKAVYAYPSEHYAFWREQLGVADLPWGAFGENLTTEGLWEADVMIGDRLVVGGAEFAVTQPRLPCYKLALRHGRPDIIELFLESGRSGFYLSVEREGGLAAGAAVELVARPADTVSVRDVAALRANKRPDPTLVRQAASHPGLAPSWRDHFLKRLTTQ